MKKQYPLFLACFLFSLPTYAQEITSEPICFTLRNEAPYRVYGDITTDYYTTPKGIKARHTGTFRLQKKGSRHVEKGHLIDRTQFCSSGPFYPGRQLEITLRTFVPIFSCKTNIELEEVVIHGKYNKDGTAKTWVTCY